MSNQQSPTSSGKRRVYLKMSTLSEALAKVEAVMAPSGPSEGRVELIPTTQALGRITARAVFAAHSSPHYSASAMDGFSLSSNATAGANEAMPVRLSVPEDARPINTGEPLPEGHDAVVMIEDVHQPDPSTIELLAAAAPWQHVRLLGEDLVATELVVTAGHRLTEVDLATLVASQVASVPVVRRPSVALLPTGTEVVGPGTSPEAGQVIDFDSTLLAGMVESWGGVAAISDPTPDEPDQLRRAIRDALAEHDLVAVIAGSSAGTADHVPNLIESLGELLVHGVRLSPGKPAALGVIDGVPVIGVPGYAVAAWTAFDLFAKPIIHRHLGLPTPERQVTEALVRRKIPSKSGTLEYLRVRLGRVGGELIAVPLKRGAGTINALAQADGLAVIPEMSEGLDPDIPVRVELLSSPAEVERTVLAVGSHDLALDLLADELVSSGTRPPRLASVHVGSMGGLRALLQGEAHLAGVHLLDPSSGGYNVPYIRRILPNRPLKLVNLVWREVGLMVRPGNPKEIEAIADLKRSGVVMINRQRGAGTRVLLDHLLAREEIGTDMVKGYSREVTTHTMVAAAVSGGAADVGLGIRAAARALGLDFIPLTRERYDLAIPHEHLDHPGVARILEIVRQGEGSRFWGRVADMGGYDFADTGKVLYEQ